MLAGISTACFYPELTERGLSYIAGLGAQAAEVFFNAPSELDDGYLRELRRTADGGGTRILSVHPFTSGLEPLLFFSDYRRRFADGIAFYQRYFHAANLLGAKLFVFHGDRRNTTRSRRFYFDRFAELCEAGRRMGVTVAQENVPRCAGYCPDFFTDMRAYLPGARFVLDIKQCVRAGYSPAEMAGAMGDCPSARERPRRARRLPAARGGGARPCRAARKGARVRLRRRRDARALPRQLRRVWGAR